MKIPFFKYQGAGNDFVLVDNRKNTFVFDRGRVMRICNRRFGVGADGLLLIETSSIADYKMRIFNADGSEPSMCGNGMRCIIDFLNKVDLKQEYQIEVKGRVLKGRRLQDKIAVRLEKPIVTHGPIALALSGMDASIYLVHTGVPHAVICVDALAEIPFLERSREIRFHPTFAPEGVNVNFVIVAQQGISLRTYERGVEGETLACGTGAAAAAWVAWHAFGLKEPIAVKTRTSFSEMLFEESMHFLFPEEEIEMIGTASFIFSGEIDSVI